MGGNMHRQTVKFPLAQDISDGLPFQQAFQAGFHALHHFLRSVEVPVCQIFRLAFSGDMAQQHTRQHTGVLGIFRGKQRPAGILVKFTVLLYHRSAPSSSGSTAWTAAIPTSIMESSGSLVVKFCIHMPGADSILVNQLS